jgi:hypothetical protein
VDGETLAGGHRLVDVARPLLDHPVHRDRRPGSDEEDVADNGLGGGDLDRHAVPRDDRHRRARASSLRMASFAPPRARISSRWPRRTKAARTDAASKNTSPPPAR